MKKKENISETKQMALLLGYIAVSSSINTNLDSKVEVLDRFDFRDDDMALICNCKPQSVRDARQRLKRKKK